MKEQEINSASENYAHNHFEMHETNHYKALKQGFEAGAKWQEKRMYSNEDMQEYVEFCIKCYQKGLPCIIAEDWFRFYRNKLNT